MGKYKITETYQYTETVYYDENDVEVERVRNNDDHLWDTAGTDSLEDWELDDIYPAEDGEA